MMNLNLSVSNITGFDIRENARIQKLIEIFNYHQYRNSVKNKYYEGKISLNDVNLGIALPEGMRGLEVGCSWGAKCVDVLAGLSMFDGFVGVNGEDVELMDSISDSNNLIAEYQKACRDELKYGCTFATLSADAQVGCKIRFHSPQTASAMWDGVKGRISCGMAILDSVPDEMEKGTWRPSLIAYYTDTDVWILKATDRTMWEAERRPHKMGRPLMEALIWNATSDKPFGRSRIKEPIRRLIDGYVRTIANATIGLEFSTAPQKYLMGVTDEQYDAVTTQKFKQYIGSIVAGTTNPETGEKPTFGQLPQGSISPHVEMIRILATQFSAATGLTVTDTGVVSEANPTSADAVIAQSKTLISMAEQLNTANGDALKVIARMAQAIVKNTSLDGLDEDSDDVIAHFKNPSMPSVAASTDAAMKIASVRASFADTDTFLEMIGFDKADIRRIKAQEQRIRGQQVLDLEFDDADQSENMAQVQEQTSQD